MRYSFTLPMKRFPNFYLFTKFKNYLLFVWSLLFMFKTCLKMFCVWKCFCQWMSINILMNLIAKKKGKLTKLLNLLSLFATRFWNSPKQNSLFIIFKTYLLFVCFKKFSNLPFFSLASSYLPYPQHHSLLPRNLVYSYQIHKIDHLTIIHGCHFGLYFVVIRLGRRINLFLV